MTVVVQSLPSPLMMSDAGTATFNHDVKLIDSSEIKLGTGGDMRLFHDATNNFINMW